MKRTLSLLSAAFLAGCVVQSFHPFYTEDAKVTPPGIAGAWQPMDKDNPTNNTERVWTLTPVADGQYDFLTYDKNRPAILKATFFRCDTNLFCDFAPDADSEKCNNVYWFFHIRPVHSVAKVETNDAQLALIPLNFDWLRRAVLSNQVAIAHVKGDKADELLFTATPAEWMKFLQQYGNDTNAFPVKDALSFRRQP